MSNIMHLEAYFRFLRTENDLARIRAAILEIQDITEQKRANVEMLLAHIDKDLNCPYGKGQIGEFPWDAA